MKIREVQISELHTNEKENRHQKIGYAIMSLLVVSGFFAVQNCFFSSVKWILMATLIYPIIHCILPKNRFRESMKYLLIVGVILCILMNPSGLAKGLAQYGNQWITAWNHHFHSYVSLYNLGEVPKMAELQFGMAMTLMFYLVWEWCYHNMFMRSLGMVELILLMIALYFQLAVAPVGVLLFAVGNVLLMMGQAFYKQGIRMMVLVCVFLFVLCTGILVATGGFQKSETAAELKERVLDQTDYIRYGEDTLPQGDLTKAYDMVGDEENKTLEIQGDSLNEMHLRGYVGSQFDGTMWKTQDLKTYYEDSAGMLEWLSKKHMEIPYQFGHFVLSSGNATKKTEYTVRNVGAYRKYLYLPYAASMLTKGHGGVSYDWQIQSQGLLGVSNYEFEAGDIGESEDTQLQQILKQDIGISGIQEAEAVYRDFAYSNYLEITDDEKAAVDTLFFKGEDWSEKNYYQITNQVRLVMQKYNTYNAESPSKFDGSEDYVTWFTEGTHKVNAASYATMATLGYRAAGIPARYVEGYYLDSEEAQKRTSKKKVTLSQADAHAWVEVYLEQVGWIPVEVVPGNYYADYSIQDVIGSPEDTVNVVEDHQETLKGTTADTIQNSGGGMKQPPKPIQKVIYLLSIIVLLLFAIFTVVYGVRIQARVRHNKRQRKLNNEKWRQDNCRMIYDQFWQLHKIMKWEGDSRFPMRCAEQMNQELEHMDTFEYERFISLIQKSNFSTHSLTNAEYRTVCMFLERVIQEAYTKATLWKRFQMKYIWAM